MAQILLVENNSLSHTLIASSLLHNWTGHDIHWVSKKQSYPVVKHSGVTFHVLEEFKPLSSYDLVVNLSPDERCTYLISNIHAPLKFGYTKNNNYKHMINDGALRHHNVFYCNKAVNCNQFQMFYSVVGESWRGEGYCLRYFPKTKTDRLLTGIIINDIYIRDIVKNGLNLERGYVSTIDLDNNIQNNLNEINKCKNIITDNEFVLHMSISLRKCVQFITPTNPLYKVEMFNSGNIHVIGVGNDN